MKKKQNKLSLSDPCFNGITLTKKYQQSLKGGFGGSSTWKTSTTDNIGGLKRYDNAPKSRETGTGWMSGKELIQKQKQ